MGSANDDADDRQNDTGGSHEQKRLFGCVACLFVASRTRKKRDGGSRSDTERRDDADHKVDGGSRDPDGGKHHGGIRHSSEHDRIDRTEHLRQNHLNQRGQHDAQKEAHVPPRQFILRNIF